MLPARSTSPTSCQGEQRRAEEKTQLLSPPKKTIASSSPLFLSLTSLYNKHQRTHENRGGCTSLQPAPQVHQGAPRRPPPRQSQAPRPLHKQGQRRGQDAVHVQEEARRNARQTSRR